MAITSLYAKAPASDEKVDFKSMVKYFHICNHTGAEDRKVCLWFQINVVNRVYIIELSMKVIIIQSAQLHNVISFNNKFNLCYTVLCVHCKHTADFFCLGFFCEFFCFIGLFWVFVVVDSAKHIN